MMYPDLEIARNRIAELHHQAQRDALAIAIRRARRARGDQSGPAMPARLARGTLCVEVTNGPERRYVTVEGPARVERPAKAHDLTALDEKYSRTDTADWAEADYAGEAAIVITPARWIALSYWD
jgi:hypothetical protein